MGTRHLICVFDKGEYKIAQYGQWDGYPFGQGARVLEFVSDESNLDALKSSLDKCEFIDYQGKHKELIEEYDRNAPEWSSDPDNRTPEQKRWFSLFVSRDIGADILKNVAESVDEEILLRNNISFAQDSLMCEWAYVVDLDANTFEVFEGYRKSESVGRFAHHGANEDGYHPVTLVKSFSLDDLPNEESFLEKFRDEEELDF